MKKQKTERDFRIIKVGLRRERDELYNRINCRVGNMIDEGLEQEARALYDLRNLNALNTVGYKEFFEYFDGKITFDKTVELIRRDTRRYAKRQMTWWAKDKEILWFHPDNLSEIIKYIEGLK